MSGQEFKVGDRVARINTESPQPYPQRLRVGTVDMIDADANIVRIAWRDEGEDRHYWPEELRHVQPLSPQARMVWHAMRAGAKRVGRYHQSFAGGEYRIHEYVRHEPHLSMRVEIALPPIVEGQS